ncbi:hypothetical protein EJ04DRAFT_563323 [Polyplosphaeria fusca]|uniref:Uncharacterized protein n=1 Tax=Polyplosphaeria fusca TaxID=682080 RepID=A0A9P4R269_9PLEO|nr:hypothetical protein EJ04DRAFT_563323 [Polyplosphaeria fusca]
MSENFDPQAKNVTSNTFGSGHALPTPFTSPNPNAAIPEVKIQPATPSASSHGSPTLAPQGASNNNDGDGTIHDRVKSSRTATPTFPKWTTPQQVRLNELRFEKEKLDKKFGLNDQQREEQTRAKRAAGANMKDILARGIQRRTGGNDERK